MNNSKRDARSGRENTARARIVTVLLSGKGTAGRYCVIDMYVPPGGGPPPHRHDFDETFILLGGELVASFRGEIRIVRRGVSVGLLPNVEAKRQTPD